MCTTDREPARDPANALARELEKGLVLLSGSISATALRNTIIANWDKLAKLAHEIHDAK